MRISSITVELIQGCYFMRDLSAPALLERIMTFSCGKKMHNSNATLVQIPLAAAIADTEHDMVGIGIQEPVLR
jgi:hypothetical protein